MLRNSSPRFTPQLARMRLNSERWRSRSKKKVEQFRAQPSASRLIRAISGQNFVEPAFTSAGRPAIDTERSMEQAGSSARVSSAARQHDSIPSRQKVGANNAFNPTSLPPLTLRQGCGLTRRWT